MKYFSQLDLNYPVQVLRENADRIKNPDVNVNLLMTDSHSNG